MEYKKEKIKEYPEYSIDTNGVVYNKNGSIKKYSVNHKGYCIVNFYVGGKRKGFAVHTLVAKQFIKNDNPQIKTQVNHKDGNKQKNCVENLEWVTGRENVEHSIKVLKNDNSGMKHPNAVKILAKGKGKTILFNSIIEAAKYLYPDKEYKTLRQVQNSIYRVLSGRRKSYLGYKWFYN